MQMYLYPALWDKTDTSALDLCLFAALKERVDDHEASRRRYTTLAMARKLLKFAFDPDAVRDKDRTRSVAQSSQQVIFTLAPCYPEIDDHVSGKSKLEQPFERLIWQVYNVQDGPKAIEYSTELVAYVARRQLEGDRNPPILAAANTPSEIPANHIASLEPRGNFVVWSKAQPYPETKRGPESITLRNMCGTPADIAVANLTWNGASLESKVVSAMVVYNNVRYVPCDDVQGLLLTVDTVAAIRVKSK